MRNIQTGSITPQFHVVFDELFSTVHSLDEDDPTWVELFVSERDYYGPDEEEEDADPVAFPEIDPSWLPISKIHQHPAEESTNVPTIVTDSPRHQPNAEATFDDDPPESEPLFDAAVSGAANHDSDDVPSAPAYDNPADDTFRSKTHFAPHEFVVQTEEFLATNGPITLFN